MSDKRYKRGLPAGDPGLVLPAAYYERIYARDRHHHLGTWRPWFKQGGKFLWYSAMMLAGDRSIIDLGCGAGHLAAMYAVFGRGKKYIGGMDYSRAAIQMAREKHAPWANFIQGNITTHPSYLKARTYKAAVLLEVLEHIYEDIALLKLIPRGRFVVGSVPDFYTDGHCRWFTTADQVRDRYSRVLKFHRIIREGGIASDNRWFVFLGTRL